MIFRTERNSRKYRRKMGQRPFSNASAARGDAFIILDSAAQARKLGHYSAARELLQDASNLDWLARHVRERESFLPA